MRNQPKKEEETDDKSKQRKFSVGDSSEWYAMLDANGNIVFVQENATTRKNTAITTESPLRSNAGPDETQPAEK